MIISRLVQVAPFLCLDQAGCGATATSSSTGWRDAAWVPSARCEIRCVAPKATENHRSTACTRSGKTKHTPGNTELTLLLQSPVVRWDTFSLANKKRIADEMHNVKDGWDSYSPLRGQDGCQIFAFGGFFRSDNTVLMGWFAVVEFKEFCNWLIAVVQIHKAVTSWMEQERSLIHPLYLILHILPWQEEVLHWILGWKEG